MREDLHFYLDTERDKMLIEFINNKMLWKDCSTRSAYIRKLLYTIMEGSIDNENSKIKTEIKGSESNDNNYKVDDSIKEENLFASIINMMK